MSTANLIAGGLLAVLLALAGLGVVLSLSLADGLRRRFPDVYDGLGSPWSKRGGWSHVRFIWSDRSRALADVSIRRQCLVLRVVHVVYGLLVALFVTGVGLILPY